MEEIPHWDHVDDILTIRGTLEPDQYWDDVSASPPAFPRGGTQRNGLSRDTGNSIPSGAKMTSQCDGGGN